VTTKRTGASPTSKRKLTLERTYEASAADVWELWTTKDGIESWWGPEGFQVKVLEIDLRPGGKLHYTMTAVGPKEVEFMKNAGMPLTTEHRATYTEVVPQRRLAYTIVADFIPGVEPYDVATLVELHPASRGVRMVLTFDAMHDDVWTQRSVMGHESELRRLDKALAG
jgi:uncharacterized protein YndB with AHSA1/START domain